MEAKLKNPGGRNNTEVIHQALKDRIVKGELQPGATLSQVQVAREFGVSRGPVREAMRLLGREGLIENKLNHRSRVVSFSIEDLEQLYASRIMIEGLAVQVSVPRYGPAQIAALQGMLDDMAGLAGEDLEAWEIVHRRFHLALVEPAGERMADLTEQFISHSERYRRLYVAGGPRIWSVGAREHEEIVAACAAPDADLAAALLARHLSRTALSVFTAVAPEHDPALVRAAVRQIAGAASSPPR